LTSLTNEKFWDEYWRKIKIPCRVDPTSPFDRCLEKIFCSFFKANPNIKLFEIGCAPGRWLVYFYEKYRYKVAGIDNSEMGVQKTLENLKFHDIEGKIYKKDLLVFRPPEKYDIVLSLGFIEHFEDVDLMIKKHLSLLKPGGKLVLGVPNFKGINFHIQKCICRHLLARHNLSVMSKEFFEGLPKKFPLEKIFVEYIGGFEPSLFSSCSEINVFIRSYLKILGGIGMIRRRSIFFDDINSRLFSCYIIGIFKYGYK